jgi:hypothetical protein
MDDYKTIVLHVGKLGNIFFESLLQFCFGSFNQKRRERERGLRERKFSVILPAWVAAVVCKGIITRHLWRGG